MAATAIGVWGNSSAVRIPAPLLERAGLRRGSAVDMRLNSRGNIEIIPVAREHRRVQPSERVDIEELFQGYTGAFDGGATWPDDEMVGAEYESWAQ